MIGEILQSDYLQEEDGLNYLLTPDQKKIYRLNLMAAILEKETRGNITNFLVDDGTGIIVLRSFEDNKSLRQLNIGEVILITGRLRVYNQERYLSPEIVKKIDPLWLKIRAKEMKHLIQKSSEKAMIQKELVPETGILPEKNSGDFVEFREIEEIIVEEENESLPNQKIFQLIKEMDLGSGAAIEEIINKSPLKDTGIIIQKMLEKGDIFQNSPGKVKVL